MSTTWSVRMSFICLAIYLKCCRLKIASERSIEIKMKTAIKTDGTAFCHETQKLRNVREKWVTKNRVENIKIGYIHINICHSFRN